MLSHQVGVTAQALDVLETPAQADGMERSRVRRPRAAKTAAAASATGAAVLVVMALYAAVHPVGWLPDETPAQVASANSGAVLWPVLVAVFALVASVAILRQPGRLSYLASGAANVLMVGFPLTMPSWLVALDPLAVVLAIIGVVGLVVSAAGWAISTPLPEAQPRWPTHHELG
jgi:hypothetical protein